MRSWLFKRFQMCLQMEWENNPEGAQLISKFANSIKARDSQKLNKAIDHWKKNQVSTNPFERMNRNTIRISFRMKQANVFYSTKPILNLNCNFFYNIHVSFDPVQRSFIRSDFELIQNLMRIPSRVFDIFQELFELTQDTPRTVFYFWLDLRKKIETNK